MNKDLYSNSEFQLLKRRLNKEIMRRATYRWWDPLVTPRVGQDRSSPLSLPDDQERVLVDNNTYTINTPSHGSIEPVKNDQFPNRGDTLAGTEYDHTPVSSSSRVTVDEIKNFIVGLSKINDIRLYYGRDEKPGTAYRDPNPIDELLSAAETDEVNTDLAGSDIPKYRIDPNGGIRDYRIDSWPSEVIVNYDYGYDEESGTGAYTMPSGEYDGEEGIPSEDFFFDDYGAPEGVSDYHPLNPGVTPVSEKKEINFDHDRREVITYKLEGGIPSSSYGLNPRNPNEGKEYHPRKATGGKKGTCNVACTGLCYTTCDSECSESCTTTCTMRCGNACTSNCGMSCTGCSSQCYSSCKTKCENVTGFACVKSGAKTVKIYTTGGTNGEPAANHIESTTYTCNGCSYSCQFYPNKKTTCWDSGCMGNCFTSCDRSCSTSCFGGCIDNNAEKSDSYKNGKGRGCSAGCTLNCVGNCQQTCESACVYTCFHACKQLCTDNCAWTCSSSCGKGCADSCAQDCYKDCSAETRGKGCAGCTNTCSTNCIGRGCRNICGTESYGACDNNCRISCIGTSCTSMCMQQCSDQCTSCVQTCGFQCGTCSSLCSSGCEAACNINCTEECANSCSNNCVFDCTDQCGGCSDLCYSCIGMCIGVCSIKCEQGCTNCANLCTWWCDTSCGTGCHSNCSELCLNSCSGSCITTVMSAANGDREQEQKSYMIFKNIDTPAKDDKNNKWKILITVTDSLVFNIKKPESIDYVVYSSSLISGVFDINERTGEINVNEDMLLNVSQEFYMDEESGAYEPQLKVFDSSKYEAHPNITGTPNIFAIVFTGDDIVNIDNDDVKYILPLRMDATKITKVEDKAIIVVIQFYYDRSFKMEDDASD